VGSSSLIAIGDDSELWDAASLDEKMEVLIEGSPQCLKLAVGTLSRCQTRASRVRSTMSEEKLWEFHFPLVAAAVERLTKSKLFNGAKQFLDGVTVSMIITGGLKICVENVPSGGYRRGTEFIFISFILPGFFSPLFGSISGWCHKQS
jgi:hypothetical protein